MNAELDLRDSGGRAREGAEDDLALQPGKHTNTNSLASGAMGPMPGVPGKHATTEGLSEGHGPARSQPNTGAKDRSADANRLRGMLGNLESGGSALPDGVAGEFSQLMGGADLSGVRIHTSGPASDHAASIGARAFTHGKAIVFAPGAYDPASTAGRHILAHELVHVVQNQRSGGEAMQLAARLDVGPSGSAVESEAEAGAHALTSGRSFEVSSHSSLPGISMFGGNDPVPEPNQSLPPPTATSTTAPPSTTSSSDPQVSSKPTTTATATSTPVADPNAVTTKPGPDTNAGPTVNAGPSTSANAGGATPTVTTAPTGSGAVTGGGPKINTPAITPVPTTTPAPAPAVNFDAKVAEVLEQRADPGAKADYAKAVSNVNIVRIQALGYTFQKSGIGNTLFQTFVFPTEAWGDHWGQVYKNNQYRGNQSAGFNADTLQATIEGLRGVLHMVGDLMALISGWAGVIALVSGLLALLTSETIIGGLTFGAIAAAADSVATITALIKLSLDIIDMILGVVQMVILIIRARSTKDPAARARFAALLKKEAGDLSANVVSCCLQVAVIAATAGTGAAFSKNAEGGFLKAFKKEFNELINPRVVFKGGIKGIGEKFTFEAAGKGVATGGRKVLGAEAESGVAGLSVLKRNKLGRVTKVRETIKFTTKNQMKGARLVQVNAAVAKIAAKGGASTIAATGASQLIVVTRAPDSKGSSPSGNGELHVPDKPGSALTTVQMWPSQIETFRTAKAPLAAAKERTEEQYANAQQQLGEAKSPAVKAKLKEVLDRSKKSGEAAGNVETDAAQGKANTDKGTTTAAQGKDQKAKADANNAKIQGEGGKMNQASQHLTPPPPKDGILGKLYNATIGKIGSAIGAAQNWLKNFVGKIVMYAAGFSKEELDMAGIENDMRFSSQQDEQSAKESQEAKQQVAPIQQKVYELQEGLNSDEQQAVQGMADAMQFIAALEEADEGLSKAIEGGGQYIEAVSPIIRHELETQAGGQKIDDAYVSPITSYADTFANTLADTTTGTTAQQQVQVVFTQMVSQFPTLNVAAGEGQIAGLIGQYDNAHHTLESQAKAEAAKVKAAIQQFVGTVDYAGVSANAASLDQLVADFDKQESDLIDQLYKGMNEILGSYVQQIEAAEAAAAATPDQTTPDQSTPDQSTTPPTTTTPDTASSTNATPVSQPKAAGPIKGDAPAAPTSGGTALPPQLRTKMEASFGADFSAVRVHQDGAAQAMGAQAFARGDDIHMAPGQYDPNSAGGQELLGHELAHVVQQRQGRVAAPQGKGGVIQDSSLEAEADAQGARAAHGEPAGASAGGAAAAATGAIQMREEAKARVADRGNGELDRRTDGDHQDEDGSGAWGSDAKERGLTDRANWYMWSRVATAAEGMGLVNAARHMRHYLGNTGATLTVSVDNMLREVPSFSTAYDNEVDEAKEQVRTKIVGLGAITAPQKFILTGDKRSDVYCRKSESQDWFYAIGGFTHWWTAEVVVTPAAGEAAQSSPDAPNGGPPHVSMTFTMHMKDRYNWDQGKSVTIAGITVKDEQLGRLHRVGLAQEFDVQGDSTFKIFEWDETGAAPAPSSKTAPTGDSRDGGRTDPRGDRGSYRGNTRGSDGGPRGR